MTIKVSVKLFFIIVLCLISTVTFGGSLPSFERAIQIATVEKESFLDGIIKRVKPVKIFPAYRNSDTVVIRSRPSINGKKVGVLYPYQKHFYAVEGHKGGEWLEIFDTDQHHIGYSKKYFSNKLLLDIVDVKYESNSSIDIGEDHFKINFYTNPLHYGLKVTCNGKEVFTHKAKHSWHRNYSDSDMTPTLYEIKVGGVVRGWLMGWNNLKSDESVDLSVARLVVPYICKASPKIFSSVYRKLTFDLYQEDLKPMFKTQIIMPENLDFVNNLVTCMAMVARSYLPNFYAIDLNSDTLKAVNITSTLQLSNTTLKRDPIYFFACGINLNNKDWYYKAFSLLGDEKVARLLEIGQLEKFSVSVEMHDGIYDIQNQWDKIVDAEAFSFGLFDTIEQVLGQHFAYNMVYMAGLIPEQSVVNGILDRSLTIIPLTPGW